MRTETETILGISPGVRSLGFAILRRREILDSRIREFRGKWSVIKANSIIESIEQLINKYNVNAVAIKNLSTIQSSKNLQQLNTKIAEMIKNKNVKSNHYSLSEIKQKLIKDGKESKEGLMKCLTEKYPELNKVFLKEKQNKNKYYVKMFEAIGVALLYYHT